MDLVITDILRGCVSSIMNAILLFLMAQPRYSKKTTCLVVVSIFILDLVSSFYFYNIGALTTLAKFDVILFFVLAVILKPFVKDTLSKWLFHLLTALNVYFIIIYLSYFLCDLFPYPFYANSFVRLLLYLGVILLYHKKLRPTYKLITENSKVYFTLVLFISINFVYYIVDSNDIEQTLSDKSIYLLLLILLAIVIYFIIFYLLQKDLLQQKTKTEKLYFEKMAYKDVLTNVGNRNGFEEFMKEAQMALDKQNYCIGAFDINNLKVVNDTMGHTLGDQYICDCCKIICDVHKTSAVFRVGGDEFIIVSKNALPTFIGQCKQDMINTIDEYNRKNLPYQISIAYGYEHFNSKKHQTLDDVKNDADRLMYEHKRVSKKSQTKI